MRNVKRPTEIPPILIKNSRKWKKELLIKIDEARRNNQKIEKKYFDRYKHNDVICALESMYSNLCCYCESRIKTVGYPHIEHYRPKRKFPEYCFDWDNLHMSCEKCNKKKGEKWQHKFPILNSVDDHPISDHLSYKWGIDAIWRKWNTGRGKTTIDHTDLNRVELGEVRREILDPVMDIIEQLNNKPDHPDREIILKDLKAKAKKEFGSVIKWAIDSYLK